MKKILVGATLAAFAFAPAIVSADCGPGHDKASMASSQPAEKPQVAQSQSPGKTAAPVVAKTTKQVKHVQDKTAKTDPSTVVARSN